MSDTLEATVKMLKGTMSSNNEERSQAERVLDATTSEAPVATLEQLMEVVFSNVDSKIRMQAIVLARSRIDDVFAIQEGVDAIGFMERSLIALLNCEARAEARQLTNLIVSMLRGSKASPHVDDDRWRQFYSSLWRLVARADGVHVSEERMVHVLDIICMSMAHCEEHVLADIVAVCELLSNVLDRPLPEDNPHAAEDQRLVVLEQKAKAMQCVMELILNEMELTEENIDVLIMKCFRLIAVLLELIVQLSHNGGGTERGTPGPLNYGKDALKTLIHYYTNIISHLIYACMEATASPLCKRTSVEALVRVIIPHSVKKVLPIYTPDLYSSLCTPPEIVTMNMELLLNIQSAVPKLFRSIPGLTDALVDIVHSMLCCNTEYTDIQMQLWLFCDEVDVNETVYDVAEEFAFRVVMPLPTQGVIRDRVMGFAEETYRAFVTKAWTPTWQEVFASIMFVSQAGSVLSEEQVEKAVQNILMFELPETNARVDFARLHAIGQLSMDHGVALHDSNEERIVEVLYGGLVSGLPVMQAKGLDSLTNFIQQGMEAATAELCVPGIVTTVIGILSNACSSSSTVPRHLLSSCLSCLQAFSTFLPTLMGRYFTEIHALLLPMVDSEIVPGGRSVVVDGEVIATLCAMTRTVDVQTFNSSNCLQIFEHVLAKHLEKAEQLTQPNASEDTSEVLDSLGQALQYMASMPHANFVQHMPTYIKALKIIVDVRSSGNSQEDGTSVDDVVYFVDETGIERTVSSKRLDDMCIALTHFMSIIDAIGTGILPYVEDLLAAILPGLEPCLHESVHGAYVEVFNRFCRICRQGVDQKLLPLATLRTMVHSVLAIAYRQTADELETPKPQDALLADSEAFRNLMDLALVSPSVLYRWSTLMTSVIEVSGPDILDESYVESLSELVVTGITESQLRNEKQSGDATTRLFRKQQGFVDDDEADLAEIEENVLQVGYTDLAGAMMNTHPEVFVKVGLPHFQELTEKLLGSNEPEQNSIGSFLISDWFDHLQGYLLRDLYDGLMDYMIHFLDTSNPTLLQSASYVMARACRYSWFQPSLTTVCIKLSQRLAVLGDCVPLDPLQPVGPNNQATLDHIGQLDRGLYEYEFGALDNVASALVAIIAEFCGCGRNTVPEIEMTDEMMQQLLGLLLRYLPARSDKAEAVVVHRKLVELMVSSKSALMDQYAESLVALLASVYRTDYCDDATNPLIKNFLTVMHEKGVLSGLLVLLPEKTQERVHKIVGA